MAISFPTSLDTLTNPLSTDYLNSPSHAGQHADANDAIEAIEAKLGINSSAVTTSHDYKLSNITGTSKALPDGTLLSELNLGENAGIALDSSLSADGKYSGIVEAGVLGETIAFGELVYFKAADSRWWKTDANADATAGAVKVGICVVAGSAAGATKILLWGKINAASLFPTLTIGAPVYIGETAGTIVVTQPVTADVIIRKIGFGNTADELFFTPDSIYVTHI